MSSDGEIVGDAREDRHPYLPLDADAAHGCVQVREGDMWQAGGTHSSGPAGTWQVPEITGDRIEAAIMEILRRAAR